MGARRVQRAWGRLRAAWSAGSVEGLQRYVTGQLGQLANDIDHKTQMLSQESCVRLMQRTAVPASPPPLFL